MKKAVAFLIFAFVTSMAWAGHDDGKITVTRLGMQKLRIEIDGRKYANSDRLLLINNLAPGYHTVTIYSQPERDNRKSTGYNNSRREQVLYTAKSG